MIDVTVSDPFHFNFISDGDLIYGFIVESKYVNNPSKYPKILVTVSLPESHLIFICQGILCLVRIGFFDKTSKETKVQSIPMMLFIMHGTTENLKTLSSKYMKVQHTFYDDTFFPQTQKHPNCFL